MDERKKVELINLREDSEKPTQQKDTYTEISELIEKYKEEIHHKIQCMSSDIIALIEQADKRGEKLTPPTEIPYTNNLDEPI